MRDLANCPIEMTLILLDSKWKILIIRDLLSGTKRFGQLKKSLATISQKVLTANLRQMEECGLVNRKVYAEVPPKVEYSLTELGYSFKSVMSALENWGLHYKEQVSETDSQ